MITSRASNSEDLARDSHGFTVVELMIATMVFSVIFLLLTFGVIRFSAAYYKGVNSAAVQDTARNITDVISRSVQFGNSSFELGAVPTGSTPGYFCAGGFIYRYKLGTVYGEPNNTTGLAMRELPASGGCDAANGVWDTLGDTTQLLPQKMRLVYLEVSTISDEGFVTVSVGVASGDLDLLCNGPTCGLTNDGQVTDAGSELHCKSGAGTEFCAVSKLKTTVQKRI
ncbi:MAG: prepilin-type N-terminal cleavage/methylation domain-containing protein [Candidatus Saccharimonadales bacterium]